jgi:uncharacterized membrane protein
MFLDDILADSFRLHATRSWKRSLAKTVTWRLFGTVATFVISALVTGSAAIAAAIVMVEIMAKPALYLLHERLWAAPPQSPVRLPPVDRPVLITEI